jgi:hypothetical protein
MGPMHQAFDEVTEPLVTAAVVGAIVTLTLALAGMVLVAALRRLRGARRAPRTRETLFVGRWTGLGPELYLVGKAAVRKLQGPMAQDRPTLAFARQMLAEVMRRQPPGQLARDFAEAQLEPLPHDGFVLSKSDVAAWIERQSRPKSGVT